MSSSRLHRPTAGFVPVPTAPQRLVVVADATLDVDMDRPLSVVDGGRVVEFPACELFDNPSEAVTNWREMIAKVRDRSGMDHDQTKVTVLSIEHNGQAIAEGREEVATITIRLLSRDGHQGTVKHEMGRLREPALVARALAARNIVVSPATLETLGLAAVRREPGGFFRACFGTSLGGGRNNVASNLGALWRAWAGPNAPSPVTRISPEEFTGVPYARVALLSKWAPDGRRLKTILRTEQPAELTRALDQRAAELVAAPGAGFTDVLATGDAANPDGPYGLAQLHRLTAHALVTRPSLATLAGVATGVFNAESGELGAFLKDLRRADPAGPRGERAERLFTALRSLEDRTDGIRAELDGLQALAQEPRLSAERQAFYRTLGVETRERLVHTEERRSRVVKDSVGLIALAGERSAHPPDLLVTNGPSGAIGLVHAYDFQVIFRTNVLEDDPAEERRLIDLLEARTGGIISLRIKDTTGCGDACMSAWMAARVVPWARRRERFYFREIGATRIAPGDCKYACALAEAFWRAAFVKTVAGVMFRNMDANFARVPAAGIDAIARFVAERTAAFIRHDLPWLIDSGDSIDEMKPSSFGFWCYRTHKVANERLPHSVDVLAAHLGVHADEALVLEKQLAHARRTGAPMSPTDLESIRRSALAEVVEPAWRQASVDADRLLRRTNQPL